MQAPIDHVLDGVYISGWRATLFADELREAGIMNVLKLYEDVPYFPDDFNLCDNPLEDGEPIPPGVLQHGVQFIWKQVNLGRPVLVMCGAGISRSSTFVLAYLLERRYDLHGAYRMLKYCHPEARPHPCMWQALITNYQAPYTLQDVLAWMLEA